MAEYIDRKALLTYLQECKATPPELCYTAPLYVVKMLPAADVVEVVRCKDCFYYSQDGHEAYCLHPKYEHWYADWYADGADDTCFHPSTKENHFCSYGERKDGAK